MTDLAKTLQALQDAGKDGIHSFDLNRIVGTIRSAARINDLKKAGYKITAVAERKGDAIGVRYFLDKQPYVATSKEGHWDFKTGKALWIEEQEPKQMELI